MTAEDIEQRRALSIVLARLGAAFEPDGTAALPGGTAVIGEGEAWFVEHTRGSGVPARIALGGALVWVTRHRAERLTVVAGASAGVHARRLAELTLAVETFRVEGRALAPAEPEELPAVVDPPAAAVARAEHLRGAGLEVVVEHGVVRGEAMGLEVARVVEDPEDPDRPRIEVGVGAFDREAMRLIHGAEGIDDQLRRVVATVTAARTAGQGDVGRAARERWLRRLVVDDPSLVGLSDLAPTEPVIARGGLREAAPAPALGTAGAERVLVVCTVGFDVGIVASVADLVARHRPDRVKVVVPARDRFELLERTVALVPRAEVAGVDPPWTVTRP